MTRLLIATLLGCLVLAACDSGTNVPADVDHDGYSVEVDCDDTNASVHPDATEICNAIDDDCDGTADVGLTHTFFADADGDGFGDLSVSTVTCAASVSGSVANSTDCDDTMASVHPGAAETCTATSDLNCDGSFGDVDMDHDGVVACLDCNDAVAAIHPGATEVCDGASTDEDCNGLADDADSATTGKTVYHLDGDGDGYGGTTSASYCHAPANYVASASDCNDGVATIHPGATEMCDGASTDEDCNGLADDADSAATGKSVYHLDGDGDGYGGTTSASYCHAPANYVASASDCNDAVAAIHPGATEVCDGASTDEDCNGLADDADGAATGKSVYHLDGDGDGYGGTTSASYCIAPANYLASSSDCDDADPAIHPGVTEVCDGVDQDCDATIDFGFTVPTTYPTIQGAVDAASDGSHLCVLAGTYTAQFTIEAKNLTLEGEDRDTVILDAALAGEIVQIRDNDSVVKNFTVTNSTTGQQVVGIYGGNPVLENVDVHGITQNEDWCNAAITIDGSTATLRDVSVHDNTFNCLSGSSGAININNGLRTAHFERVSVTDNTFTVGSQYRGAVFLYEASLEASNLIIANNQVDGTVVGCGSYAYGIGTEGAVDLSIVNAAIVGNMSGSNMSSTNAIAMACGGVVHVRNLVVAFNTSAGESSTRLFDIPADADAAYIDVFENDPTTNDDWGAFGTPIGTNGIFEADPLFVDISGASASTWNLSPGAGSSLIDAGDPTIFDLDATRSDVGAYAGPLATW